MVDAKFKIIGLLVCFFSIYGCGNLLGHMTRTIYNIQRTTCISQDFWPPLKPKIKSVFTTLSLDCFIR